MSYILATVVQKINICKQHNGFPEKKKKTLASNIITQNSEVKNHRFHCFSKNPNYTYILCSAFFVGEAEILEKRFWGVPNKVLPFQCLRSYWDGWMNLRKDKRKRMKQERFRLDIRKTILLWDGQLKKLPRYVMQSLSLEVFKT